MRVTTHHRKEKDQEMATTRKTQKASPSSKVMAFKTEEVEEVGINVPIPVELHRRLRVRQIEEGMTLREAVTAAVEEWVG